MTTARDALSDAVVRAEAEARPGELLAAGNGRRISHAAVFDEGRFCGLARLQDALLTSPDRILADLLPDRPPPVVTEATPLDEVCRVMRPAGPEAVLVLGGDGEFLGAVTRECALRATLKEEQRLLERERRLRARVEADRARLRSMLQAAEDRGIVLEDRVRQGVAQLAEAHRSPRDQIAARRQAEEQARRHLAELAHAGRLSTMGEMAAGLAHELNQPLTAVVNYAEGCVRLVRSGVARPDELCGEIEALAAQAQRAAEIIRRLRGFVRKRQPCRSMANVNDLVAEVAELVAADARARRVRLDLEPARELLTLVCDTIQIEQVILNLVTNAIEALADADPPVGLVPDERCVVIRTASAGEDAIQIEVADNGPGLPAGADEQVFDSFFTTKPNGMGMGLSISRSIVEAHGGRLWATPNADHGVTFRIRLPLSKPGEVDER